MSSCKRVAVVGCGLSGMGAVRSLKEEDIEPVCFEKSAEIGGTWCYRKEGSGYDSATVMSTTCLLHSKELGAVSNYPFPDDFPNYMRQEEVFNYIQKLCDELDVRKHIICNREVIEVKRSEDYDTTGRWKVTVRDAKSDQTTTDTFDGVVLCSGNNGPPVMPPYPGMDKFRGRIMHSQQLRTFESFANERVVVVGACCSGMDAAVEISGIAKQVYWSVRTPSWIASRIGTYGLPIDYITIRRYITFLQKLVPISLASKVLELLFLRIHFNHKLYGIKPVYPILCRDPIINDVIPSKLLNGTVKLKKDIKEITECGVIFEGDDTITEVDTIIMATGYKFHIPFLEQGVVPIDGKGKICLYKCIFPPHLKHNTIAMMGFLLPLGPGIPIGELQARWIARVFSGKATLPNEEDMKKEIDTRFRQNAKRYSPSEKMSQRVDFVPYLDDIASEIGVKPNFWKMAVTDPKLFFACVFGPCVSYQYRLVGPHKWEGAREAILDVPRRVRKPLNQKGSEKEWFFKDNHILLKFLLTITIAAMLFVLSNGSEATCCLPISMISHSILLWSVVGNFTYFCFLPTFISFWIWFPKFMAFTAIGHILFTIVYQ